MNLQNYFNNSRNYFFLDILIFLTFFSLISGTAIHNSIIVLTNIIFILFCVLKRINFKSSQINFFLFIVFMLFGNIIFSENYISSIIRSLNIIKLVIFSYCLLYLFENLENFYQNLLKIIFFLIVTIILSMIYQYFNGSIFGHSFMTNHGFSLSGFFKEEYIAGSVLSKLFLISLPLFFEFKYKNIIILNYILLVLFFILLANQRTAIIMSFGAVIIYFLFENKINIKKKILLIFAPVLFFCIILFSNNHLYDKFINKTLSQFNLNVKQNENFTYNFKNTIWGAHFLTAIEIFKDNKFSGSGLKTFRIVCGKDKYSKIDSKNKDYRCSTHPHNIYLELLAETGIIIFLIFTGFLLYFTFLGMKKIIENKVYYVNCFSVFFILFWPIQTTGSLFSSINGFFYFVGFVFFYNSISRLNVNEK